MAGGKGKQIVELGGPEEYSPNQSFGFSDEAAKLFEEMYTSFS